MFKLLSVDVQGGPEGVLRHGEGSTTAEGAARIYLRGGPEEYSRGGVVEDMRKPYIGVRPSIIGEGCRLFLSVENPPVLECGVQFEPLHEPRNFRP